MDNDNKERIEDKENQESKENNKDKENLDKQERLEIERIKQESIREYNEMAGSQQDSLFKTFLPIVALLAIIVLASTVIQKGRQINSYKGNNSHSNEAITTEIDIKGEDDNGNNNEQD